MVNERKKLKMYERSYRRKKMWIKRGVKKKVPPILYELMTALSHCI